MTKSESRIYLKNLNGLRFVLAALVVIEHCEMHLGASANRGFAEFVPHLLSVGNMSVTFFFVLSGFLITYLLYKEIDKSGTVSVRNFYVRRILRIWPLYYLAVFVGLVVLPNFPTLFTEFERYDEMYAGGIGSSWLYYLFLIPNVGRTFDVAWPYIEQLWSIGAEEQFYLIWPVYIKRMLRSVVGLLAFVVAFNVAKFSVIVVKYLQLPMLRDLYLMKKLPELFIYARLDCMAIGGLFAYLFYHGVLERRAPSVLKNPVYLTAMTAIVVLAYSWDLPESFVATYYTAQIVSVVFGAFILLLCSVQYDIKILENGVMSRLGDYSYGIYVLHMFAMIFAFMIYEALPERLHWSGRVVIFYVAAVGLSTLFAHLSYTYFEKRFLLLKQRFTIVRAAY